MKDTDMKNKTQHEGKLRVIAEIPATLQHRLRECAYEGNTTMREVVEAALAAELKKRGY